MESVQQVKTKYGPKLFIGGLNPVTTPQSLRNYFEKICAVQIVKVEYSRKSKKRKGFGYLIIHNPEDIPLLLNQSHYIDNKLVDVMEYGIEATTKWYTNKSNSIKIKLRNVRSDVTEENLTMFFERFLRVLTLNIFQETSRYSNRIENTAYVELLNANKPFKIGSKNISCDPLLIQSIKFSSIERLIRSLAKLYSASYIEQQTTQCLTDTTKKLESLLNFERANQLDKHSKYEFIKTQVQKDINIENYRFNIRTPQTNLHNSQPLDRRVGVP